MIPYMHWLCTSQTKLLDSVVAIKKHRSENVIQMLIGKNRKFINDRFVSK